MAYKNIDSPDFLDDILTRKEFYSVKLPDRTHEDINNYDSMKGEFLELRGHQLFVNNFESPDTNYMRLLLKHQTGVGKTLSAISIAQRFIDVYKKIYENTLLQTGTNRKGRIEADLSTPSVFVIGFTKSIFVKEILKYPEFGFISYEERAELERLQKAALSGMSADVERSKEFYSMIKRRITNKTKSGFYKFYGYQEFVNKLFYSDTINLTDLETMITKKLTNKKENSQSTGKANKESATGRVDSLEELIYYYMEKGEIQVNTTLLKQFENSLLICDEVHSTYNSLMKNNYGVAIQYVLDYTPSLRAVFLSATIIYHSPSESIDLLNLLLPKSKRLNKKDFFTARREPKPGKIEELGELSRGYISFLQETNPEYYPEKIYEGEMHKLKSAVTINNKSITEIPYLKFVSCPMSPFHEKAYYAFLKDTDQLKQSSLNNPVLPTDAYSLNDMIYPIPSSVSSNTGKKTKKVVDGAISGAIGGAIDDAADNTIDTLEDTENGEIVDETFANTQDVNISPGVNAAYRSSHVKEGILKSSESWKKANGINVEFTKLGYPIITGKWLKKENVGKYSSKYEEIINGILNSFKLTIDNSRNELENLAKSTPVGNNQEISADTESDIIKKNSMKIMIYHPRVKMSGVLQIEQMLKENGFIGQSEEPTSKTLCTFCGVERDAHTEKHLKSSNIPRHEYRPARLIMAHSDFDKVIMDQYINMYNEPSNTFSEYIKVLVGSKIIRQSYDIKSVQIFYIVSLPIGIPELIQILGRIARMGSHKDLPANKRKVLVNMLISSFKNGNLNTYEEIKYVEKMLEYKIIQEIEREFNKNAIDADIMRSTIMSEYTLRQYFGNERVDSLIAAHPEKSRQEALKELMYAEPSEAKEVFGNLYYLPKAIIPASFNVKDLNTSTFYAYRYFEKEAQMISHIIKRLFIKNKAWKYADLWEEVKNPPWKIDINTQIFSEGNFALVLDALSRNDNIIWNTSSSEEYSYLKNVKNQSGAQTTSYKMIDETEILKKKMIRSLFSQEEKIITISIDSDSKPQRFRINQIGEFYILFPVISSTEGAFTFSNKKTGNQFRAVELMESKDVLVKDVESFVREIKYSPGIRINLDTWVKESKNEYNYIIKKQKFIQTYGDIASKADDIRGENTGELRSMLWEYTPAFQKKFLKEIIEWGVLRDKKISSSLENIYASVIDLYDEFSAIIYISDILTYREVAKKFTSGKIVVWKKGESKPSTNLDKYLPIGFIDKDSVSLFDDKWFKLNKSALNIRTEFTENSIIIGYFDMIKGTEDIKFKVRKPVQEIRKNSTAGDIRLLERGIVCETKNKPELIKLMRELKIDSDAEMKKKKYTTAVEGTRKIKIRNICDIIRDKLIDLEAVERQKDSKIKYFYMFYDQQPSLTA